MIVQPDFLDHWKTRMLCDILQDEAAPLYVIRLWGHCQNRKTHRLPSGNPAATKAICHAPHDAEKFHSAMIEAGFLREDADGLYAHEWDSVNQYLVNSWDNGKRGGRPKKETQTKPTGNPKLTQKEPIREEKRREVDMCTDAFDKFWKAYPKKKSKGRAEKAFRKIGVDVEVIIAAVQKQIQTPEWKKDGGQYIPHPETYLNARCWEDELEIDKNIIATEWKYHCQNHMGQDVNSEHLTQKQWLEAQNK